MKVYVVTNTIYNPYEDKGSTSVVRVFFTEEKAREYIKVNERTWSEYEYEEFDVE